MDKMTPERVISKLADLAERHAEAAKHYADQPSSFGQALAWTQEKALAAEYEAMAETVRTLQGERDRLRDVAKMAETVIDELSRDSKDDLGSAMRVVARQIRAALHLEPLGEGGGL